MPMITMSIVITTPMPGMSMSQGDHPIPTSATMQTNGAMSNSTNKHLEIHVYDTKTGTVVTNATYSYNAGNWTKYL